MYRKKIKIIIIIILILTLFLSGCGIDNDKKVVKIAAILPLTGNFSAFGQEYKRIIKLAIENLECKKEISVYFEDGMGDVKTSLSAYKKINTTAKPDIVISILSNVCLALKPLIMKNDQIFFAEAAHPDIVKNNNGNIFRHSQTSIQEAQIISSFLNSDDHYVTCLAPTDDYFSALVNSLKEKDLTDKIEQYNKNEYNKNNIQKILPSVNDDPDNMLFLGGYGAELGTIIKDARSNDYNKIILTSLASFLLPGVEKGAGDYFNYIYAPYFMIDTQNPEYLDLKKNYYNKYKTDMPIYSLLEYNTIYLITLTLNELQDFSVNKFSSYLKNVGQIKGIGETMIIKDNGNINPKLKLTEM